MVVKTDEMDRIVNQVNETLEKLAHSKVSAWWSGLSACKVYLTDLEFPTIQKTLVSGLTFEELLTWLAGYHRGLLTGLSAVNDIRESGPAWEI